MEMPVLCDCGKWVELNDTLLPPGRDSGETICRDCYQDALEAEDIEIDLISRRGRDLNDKR